jgi:hypothetical protein
MLARAHDGQMYSTLPPPKATDQLSGTPPRTVCPVVPQREQYTLIVSSTFFFVSADFRRGVGFFRAGFFFAAGFLFGAAFFFAGIVDLS